MAREAVSGRGLTDRKIVLAVLIGCVGGLIFSLFAVAPPSVHTTDLPKSRGRLKGEKLVGKLEALEVKLGDLEQKRSSYEKLVKDAEGKAKDLEDRQADLLRLQEGVTAERDRMLKELESKKGAGVKVGAAGTAKGKRTGAELSFDASVNPELSNILVKIARVKEVLVIFADKNQIRLLEVCLQSVKQAGIMSYVVVALDEPTKAACVKADAPVYLHMAEASAGDAHAFARRKFSLLHDFLVLGYRVLVADADVVFLQNPFGLLSRDADVESMSSQGMDDNGAYGEGAWIDDPQMGWARYAVTSRIFFLDSGFFYLQCTTATVELVDRLVARLVPTYNGTAENAFNEEIFLPSHTGYEGLYISRRVLDYNKFMNARYLFKGSGGVAKLKGAKPVVVHVNTDKDKEQVMSIVLDSAQKDVTSILSRFTWV